ncbi:MAG: IgGFc-binding protein [Candidatus Kapaibacteriota bacterium]|jgi:hypothetical protein
MFKPKQTIIFNRLFKNRAYFIFLVILCNLFTISNSYSQFNTSDEDKKVMGEFNIEEKKPEGTEFWLTFMLNNEEPERVSENTKLHLELFITGDRDAKVTIEIKSIGFKETIKINKGTVRSLLINPLAQIRSSESVEEKNAIHITSDNAITVYGLTRRKQTTDTFMGLPTNVIGKNYRVICYNASVKLSEFAIVATEDSTVVKITPTVETQLGRPVGQTFEVKLNKGDVYQVIARDLMPAKRKNDLTGTQINANKKISVFSGHQCAYVPDKVFACNHLIEQVPPIVSWGKHFYIGMLKKRSKYTYRVLADKDSTKVFENGKLQKILMAGDHFEKQANDHVQITADKPVLVAQYSQGYKNGDQIGDPMMLLISPTQQFLKKYRFATPVNGTWEHFVNIIVPNRATGSLIFDGKRLDSTKFKPLANSSYAISQLNISFGTHELEAAVPFGMSSYGFGFANENYDAYGTIGGQSFIEYVPKEDEEEPYIDYEDKNDTLYITVRDDRKDDTGINLISVLMADGLKANIPKYDIGTPQTVFKIEKGKLDKLVGKIQLSIEDMYKNTYSFTVCYAYDAFKGAYRFIVNDGLNVDCLEDSGEFYGISARFLINQHSIDNKTFSSSGNLSTNGYFSDANAFGGYGSIYFVKRLQPKLMGKIKLNFDQLSGEIIAPDSVISKTFNTETGQLENFQEQSIVKLNGINLNLNLGIEYSLNKLMYADLGLSLSMLASKSITHTKEIIIPQNKAYDESGNTSKTELPSELSSLNTFGVGFYGGLGFNIPINADLLVNIETNYNYRLSSMINDNNWNINSLSISTGLRFRL